MTAGQVESSQNAPQESGLTTPTGPQQTIAGGGEKQLMYMNTQDTRKERKTTQPPRVRQSIFKEKELHHRWDLSPCLPYSRRIWEAWAQIPPEVQLFFFENRLSWGLCCVALSFSGGI